MVRHTYMPHPLCLKINSNYALYPPEQLLLRLRSSQSTQNHRKCKSFMSVAQTNNGIAVSIPVVLNSKTSQNSRQQNYTAPINYGNVNKNGCNLLCSVIKHLQFVGWIVIYYLYKDN